MASTSGSTGKPRTREKLRLHRQAAILDLALDIATREGHDAVTMQRLAEELECGIASVYRVFPSRDALVAELLHQSLDVLHASWLLGTSHLEQAASAAGLDASTVALARAVGGAWFWVVADERYPAEVDLARRLFIDRQIVVPTEQAALILPATLRLLDQGRQGFDAAVDAGSLTPGNGIDRSILFLASVTGVVLTSKFSRWDANLFDSRRLAREVVATYFTAWGAPPDALATVMDLAVTLGDEGALAPAIEP
jgi:AcrR family transcriptional regulator